MNRGRSNPISVRWIAPCAVAAISLAIAPGLLFYYDVTPKIVVLYFATGLALPFVDSRLLLNRAEGRLFCLLLAGAFLSLSISTVFSVRTDLSIFGTNWRRFGLITQAALLLFSLVAAADLSRGVERVRAYLRASTLATVLIAFYGILQYLGWDPWLDAKTYHVGTGVWTIVRPPGTLGYVSYFASYLVFGVSQGLALSRVDTKAIWRWAGLAAVALGSVAIVLSGTRAAWLALAVGGAVLWGLEARRPSARLVWLTVAVAALAVLFYVSPAGLQLRGRMRWFRDDPVGGARLNLWRDSLSLVGRFWLKGSGPETFSVEFPQVQSRDLSRAFPEFYHESAHNIFLDAGTSQGVPGLLILLAATGLAWRLKVNARRDVPVLLAGFAGILTSNQFSVFTVPTALAFWITLVMLLTAEPGPAAAAGHAIQNRRGLWLIPISLGLIVAAARLAGGDWHLARMRTALDASRFEQANAEYKAAERWGMHADLWYSRKLLIASQETSSVMDSVARTQEALASGISATKTADDPYNAWMNLGLIYARLNNADRTEYCIRQAISSSPNWYKPHLALAQLLSATHRQEEGRKELQLAHDLNPAIVSGH
jgi:O-antigen ligase